MVKELKCLKQSQKINRDDINQFPLTDKQFRRQTKCWKNEIIEFNNKNLESSFNSSIDDVKMDISYVEPTDVSNLHFKSTKPMMPTALNDLENSYMDEFPHLMKK